MSAPQHKMKQQIQQDLSSVQLYYSKPDEVSYLGIGFGFFGLK